MRTAPLMRRSPCRHPYARVCSDRRAAGVSPLSEGLESGADSGLTPAARPGTAFETVSTLPGHPISSRIGVGSLTSWTGRPLGVW